MFYCDPCAEQRKWPSGLAVSRDPCETCGQVTACNDVPSRLLPVPLWRVTSNIGAPIPTTTKDGS